MKLTGQKNQCPSCGEYFNNITAAKVTATQASEYRLVKRGGEYFLQGLFLWSRGHICGGEWKNIPTVIEEAGL